MAEGGIIRNSALDVGARAVNWQMARMDTFDYIRTSRVKTANSRRWMQGALYVGASRWSETVEDKDLQGKIETMAKSNQYRLGDRPRHGDDHVIGQTYLWLYEKTGNEAVYGPTKARFDEILSDKPTNSLEYQRSEEPGYEATCQARWCWADALFMAPRTWLKLSNATNDPRYFDYADSEYWTTTDFLFSEEHGLYFRDGRFFDRKSDNGAPVFWSRGNGWVFAALPLIIDDIAEGHPSKARYIDHYKKMAASLVKLQREDGYWPSSLMDPGKVTTPESSGTGFITFGLAWGVNSGVLTDQASADSATKGWEALAAAVDSDGMLHWVQQVGGQPDPVQEDDTQLYGVGALLLAASEMTKWRK